MLISSGIATSPLQMYYMVVEISGFGVTLIWV